MPDGNSSTIPARPWREIAQQLAVEMDPTKMLHLCLELNRAFNEQGAGEKPGIKSA